MTVSPQRKTENSAGIVVAAFRSSCQSAERRRVEEADGELLCKQPAPTSLSCAPTGANVKPLSAANDAALTRVSRCRI